MSQEPETTSGESAPKAVESTLSVAVLQELILKKHGLKVGEDDPLMAAFTLHEAFVADYEAMLERHNRAITALMGGTVGELRSAVAEEGKVVADAAHALSTSNMLALIGEHQKAMGCFLGSVRSLCTEVKTFAAIMAGGSAALFLAGVALRLWR